MTDLHEPFRAALAAHLTNATAVVDPFHVVGVGTRVVDRTCRRVERDTPGDRGHKGDPLYRRFADERGWGEPRARPQRLAPRSVRFGARASTTVPGCCSTVRRSGP